MSNENGVGVIQVLGGKLLDVRRILPTDLDLDMIAVPLSRLCRFNGHGQRFYSVAEHSVVVSLLAQWFALELPLKDQIRIAGLGLLHDAHEAFIGDAPSPLKPLAGDLPGLDWQLDSSIGMWLGLPVASSVSDDDRKRIKAADLMALHIEKTKVMGHELAWPNMPGVVIPEGLSLYEGEHLPKPAEHIFLLRWEECFGINAKRGRICEPVKSEVRDLICWGMKA